jgi:predicted enzyme related to lactoylglutathione lyase
MTATNKEDIMSETHGTVHWNELNTHHVGKAKAYYAKVCGWSFDSMPMEDGEYHVARIGEQMIAGVFDLSGMPEMKELPSHWLTYLSVDDVDATAQETQAMGGKIMRAPWDVPGVGRVSIICDPSGAALGIMTPSQ